MTAKKRLKAKALPTPKTRQQAEDLMHDIGDLQRQVERINNAMNDQLVEIKRGFEDEAQPINEDIDAKFQALRIWSEENKNDLLDGKKKSVELATGTIGWRLNPPKISLSKIGEVLKAIKVQKLDQFLRTKEEVNKDAMLVDEESKALAGSIKGVSVVQTEDYYAIPFETKIERIETVKKVA